MEYWNAGIVEECIIDRTYMKPFLIVLIITAFSYADIIPSFFIDYSYGIPFKHTCLGRSIIKKNVSDSLKFDHDELIYGSFGKGNKITSGFDFNITRHFNVSMQGTYHFPSPFVIKRRLQEAVDDDTYNFSMISANVGFKFLIKYKKVIFFSDFCPGYYIPLEVTKHSYATGIDSYYNFTGTQEEYSGTLSYKRTFGFLSSLGFQIEILKKIFFKLSAGPEYVYMKRIHNSESMSFSSFRLISGLSYTFMR